MRLLKIKIIIIVVAAALLETKAFKIKEVVLEGKMITIEGVDVEEDIKGKILEVTLEMGINKTRGLWHRHRDKGEVMVTIWLIHSLEVVGMEDLVGIFLFQVEYNFREVVLWVKLNHRVLEIWCSKINKIKWILAVDFKIKVVAFKIQINVEAS